MSTMELMREEYGTWDEHDADYYDNKTSKVHKKKLNKVKAAYGGLMKKKKPINMATGGLMSQPPFIAKQDEEDNGINPYDVNTPESARQGLPSRLLTKKRTRFNKGGIMDRQEYSKGDEAIRLLRDIDLPDEPLEEGPAEGDIPGEASNKLIMDKINRLEKEKEETDNITLKAKLNNEIKSLESKVRVRAATGGYMDENQIAEETPLALSIGGSVRRPEERKDYQAYAEGDMVEDESLLSPMGMEEENAIAETDMEMEAEDDMDYDSILDTSALSEEEETVLDEAIEMHPELEAILPKLVATEFTEDELVEGPGDGTSDSIPALLSDGEFVFTAKAVKNIGVDRLRKMMKSAEESYDAGQVSQEENAEMSADDSLLA